MPTALLVEDDKGALDALAALVENLGFTTVMAGTWSQARAELLRQPHDVVLLDVLLPGGSGIDLLLEIPKDRRPHVVLMSGDDAVRKAFAALPMQELHFVQKPIDVAELQSALGVVRRRCTRSGNGSGSGPAVGADGASTEADGAAGGSNDAVATAFGPRTGLARLLGESAPIRLVRELIARVAPLDLPVFVEGESGTGKELVALSVHELSRRSSGPFIALNCGALPENLIDSELFGHERGSFTGADRAKSGVFEQAHGGTLFLDEVSEMPAEQQVRFLRTLETGRIRRVGGSAEIEVDVRIVAATNRRLEDAIAENRFREDLLHRLSVFPIVTPPLRSRPEDIELLARHFLSETEEHYGRKKPIEQEALVRLVAYEWPGNVRQLKNVMQRAYVMADGRITVESLPEPIAMAVSRIAASIRPENGRSANGNGAPGPSGNGASANGANGNGPSGIPRSANNRIEVEVGSSIADAERLLIEATLVEQSGDKRKVAETLGVSLRTLYKRLKQYSGDGELAD